MPKAFFQSFRDPVHEHSGSLPGSGLALRHNAGHKEQAPGRAGRTTRRHLNETHPSHLEHLKKQGIFSRFRLKSP